eukprot:RCo000822
MADICTGRSLLSAEQKRQGDEHEASAFRKEFLFCGRTLVLKEKYHLGFGGCLWNGGEVLARYLESHFPRVTGNPPKCVELGCGLGLAGIVLGMLGARVTLTDLEYVLPLVVQNLEENVPELVSSGMLDAAPYSWGTTEQTPLQPPYDHILLADCIYDEELIAPLLQSLRFLCAPDSTVWVCFEWRLCEAIPTFFREVAQYFS